ncbi:MAG: PAS domain S-box protein, partial [Cytophagales bacterium]|nr:PAS domain S-box protein [Cytophagales bacterium]
MAIGKNLKKDSVLPNTNPEYTNSSSESVTEEALMEKNLYHGNGNGSGGTAVLEPFTSTETATFAEVQIKMRELERINDRNTQALMEAVDAVVQIDGTKSITFFNKAAVKMFGYEMEEVLGQNVKMIVPMEHRAAHDQYVDNNVKTGVNKVVGSGRDLEASRKDGSKFWINLSLSKSQVGTTVEYTAFIKDITDMKLLQKEQQQSLEEMKAQEEELRQNMEEMTATQEEMVRKQMEMDAQMSAINSTSAYIEFNADGQVVVANELFLATMKYSLKEIEGKHHRIFCDPSYTASREYERFWENLRQGKPQTGEFKRIAKDGSEVWLLASYTPVLDKNGKVEKVIKLASDITEAKLQSANYEGQISAIGKSLAVIEFNMDGSIISANDNFLQAVGYSASEIKGQHHSLFVDPIYAKSFEYREFWAKLNRGEFLTDEFKRQGKGGKEI